jgi:hypothetical protein
MKVYKRTVFSLIKGLIIAPFSGLVVFILAQIFLQSLSLVIWGVLGVAAAVAVAYITVFSEAIYFELDDDGSLRYFKRGSLQNTYELAKYRIGYHRKTEWGILGNNDIRLKFLDTDGEQSEIDAGPLGTTQFDEMFAAMEEYAIKDVEQLAAEKKL